eukprot:TRINITY_DN18856_c0_g1_i1.p2 TRINITY_DN18856_c0_g1~~TRINITY_DN18856_c0_g1_i1.p2  ORF type:complete len:120 (+),score=1.73 TRINITY_DN18856_c0_g1_i1:372-731(+)
MFAQLYTIHGLIDTTSVPLVFALLPNKTVDAYRAMLDVLKEAVRGFSPTTFTTDYEQAMIRAVGEIFPTTSHQGCFFHFKQCILREVQERGWKGLYETDGSFRKHINMVGASRVCPSIE